MATMNGIPARTSTSRSFTTSASRWSSWELREKSRWTSPVTFNRVMPSACSGVLSCFLGCCSDLLGNRGLYHTSFSSRIKCEEDNMVVVKHLQVWGLLALYSVGGSLDSKVMGGKVDCL